MWENATLAQGFPSAVYPTGYDLASQQWPARFVRDPPQQPLSSTPAPMTLPVFQTAAQPARRLPSTEELVQRLIEQSQARVIRRNPSRTGVFSVSASAAHPSLMHQDTTSRPAHNTGPLNSMYWNFLVGEGLYGNLEPSCFSTEGQQKQGAAPLISLEAPDSTTDKFVPCMYSRFLLLVGIVLTCSSRQRCKVTGCPGREVEHARAWSGSV